MEMPFFSIEYSPWIGRQVLERCGQWHWRGSHSTAASIWALQHSKGPERIRRLIIMMMMCIYLFEINLCTCAFFIFPEWTCDYGNSVTCVGVCREIWVSRVASEKRSKFTYFQQRTLTICYGFGDCHVIIMWSHVVRLDRLRSMWLHSVSMLTSSRPFDSTTPIATLRTGYMIVSCHFFVHIATVTCFFFLVPLGS